MAVYDLRNTYRRVMSEHQHAQKLEEQGLRPSPRCKNCHGRGFLRRIVGRESGKNVYEIVTCGCVKRVR